MQGHARPARVPLNLRMRETRGRFPEMDGDVQKALRNAPAYWGLCFFPSLLMTTIYHNLLFIVLWRFLYCYANATAIFPISKMLTGKTRSPEALLAFRLLLMSSFRWPLNCFTCTFSSFRVKARSPSWGGIKKGQKCESFQKELACFLAVRALKRRRQPSGGVQTRQLVSVERHQLNRRSDAIRQQEPRELVQPSTQIDRGEWGGGVFTRQRDDGDNVARRVTRMYISPVCSWLVNLASWQ